MPPTPSGSRRRVTPRGRRRSPTTCSRRRRRREVEVIFGSYDLPGAALLDVVDIMDRLRRECPWTGQQTHESLSHYLLEEAHETLEALDNGDSEHLREELGDLLMQIVFHARIASEGEGWDIDDVAAGIAGKLIYRNPHVFGDDRLPTPTRSTPTGSASRRPRSNATSPHEGIPATLPALAYADKVLGRSATSMSAATTSGLDCSPWSPRRGRKVSTPRKRFARPYAGWPSPSGDRHPS